MSDALVVSGTQKIVVNPATRRVSVVLAGPVGPQGPQGPQGISGGEAAAYYHTQVAPSASWVINHNLGYRPNITVEEVGTGYIIMCSEIHHSVTQVELQFNIPRAGTARLS